MSRLTPQRWSVLECIFTRAGFAFVRKKSSHRVYEKAGVLRPLIIPEYDEVGVEIVAGLIKTAKLSRKQYFAFLADC